MTLAANNGCLPLMEACTLDLYKKNIFRVTGLPVDATSKDISRQVQKLQMLEEMGGGAAGPQTAFALAEPHTSDEIRDALSRMKEPEHRIIDEFFWFWPEKFGASKEDLAIQAMLTGDKKTALQLWKDREKSGSHVAQHNMAILYHMYAVDWTNSHIGGFLDNSRESEIKACWQHSFARWEPMIEDDDLWDMLKQRIRSLDDEALTTGFARRMLKLLPEALDRVNAEAALKLAEQGHMDWARFHVDFMRETHPGLDDVDSTSEMVLEPTKRRVEQHLESFANQVKKSPQHGADLASTLLDHCRPMMGLFDLFHGEDAHQRNDIFDNVAETVLQMVVSHQKATGDNKAFVELLQRTLKFASGAAIRERIIENISIGEGNLQWSLIEPLFEVLKDVAEGDHSPSQKLIRFQQLIMPKIPSVASELGVDSTAYEEMMDTLAHALRGISVAAHNEQKDFETAEKAIQLALKLAKDQELKKRIKEDVVTLTENKKESSCYFCGVNRSEDSAVFEFPMHGDIVKMYRRTSYKKLKVPIARCKACQDIHEKTDNIGCAVGISCTVVGLLIGCLLNPSLWVIAGGFCAVLGAFVVLALMAVVSAMMGGASKLKKPRFHPEVIKLINMGWHTGESP